MDDADPVDPQFEESARFDLARRLERYRRRIEAEGRPRAVRWINCAIEDAEKRRGSDG